MPDPADVENVHVEDSAFQAAGLAAVLQAVAWLQSSALAIAMQPWLRPPSRSARPTADPSPHGCTRRAAAIPCCAAGKYTTHSIPSSSNSELRTLHFFSHRLLLQWFCMCYSPFQLLVSQLIVLTYQSIVAPGGLTHSFGGTHLCRTDCQCGMSRLRGLIFCDHLDSEIIKQQKQRSVHLHHHIYCRLLKADICIYAATSAVAELARVDLAAVGVRVRGSSSLGQSNI